MFVWRHKIRGALAAAGVCLVITASGFAQDPRGAITGRVVDPSEAVLVDARIRVTNVDTGVSASARTNEAGLFRIPFLVPGVYDLTAEMSGFRTYSQPKLQVRIGDVLELAIRLDLGASAERVEVSAAAPLLETGSASLGQVIDERRLLELPQKGGNPFDLAKLLPGVVNMSALRTMKSASPEGTSQISVNGSGLRQAQFQIDGVNNTTNDRGRDYARVAYIPPSDAIVEFKMQANAYDASAGHVLGPVIAVNTKGGTKELHGTLYYWLKNSALDASDFFVNKAGQSKPVYQDHRYGLSVGGPVRVPRLYGGQNKTFFFYAWEENRYANPATTAGQTQTVPTAAEREGDFSALLPLGSRYQIYNPFTTRAIAGGRYERDPFAGNRIPRSLLDTVGLGLVSLYPQPNQPSAPDGQNNFFYADVRVQQYDSHMGRLDHAFSENNRLFVRVNHYGYTIPKNSLGVPATLYYQPQYNQGAALDDVMVLSPSLILNVRYGVTSAQFPEERATRGTDLAKMGFSPALTNLLDARLSTVPRVAVSPFTTLSDWANGDGTNTSVYHNWVGDLTKLKGRHSLRFGADARLMRTFGLRNPAAISPDFQFATTYTRSNPLDDTSAAPLGQQLAALLVGIPGGSMTVPANQSYAIQDKYFGLYLQDDFKVTPRLTLNVGLRYELERPVTERFDRLVSGFAFDAVNPVSAAAAANYARNPIPELPVSAFSARGGLTWVNQNGTSRSPYSGSGHWLPRIGVAWQFAPQTVFRAGYGIYFGSLGVDTFVPIQTGFSQSTPIQASLDNGVTYVATTSNPLPQGLIPPAGASGGLSTNLGQALSGTWGGFYDANHKAAYSQRWSFGLQRTLPGEFMLDATYLGNRVTNIAVARNINGTPAEYLSKLPVRDQPTITFLTTSFPNPFYGLNSVFPQRISRANLLRPYPQFGDLSVLQPVGYSWYHALQVRLERRLSKGFTFQMSYTHSKYMQAASFLNPTDPVPHRVISDMDRPNLFSLSGLWEIPVGRGRRFGAGMPAVANAIVGNWQLDASEIHQSGAPLEWTSNVLFSGNIKDIQLPPGRQTVDRWFNIDAGFNRIPAQQLASNIRTFPLRFNGVRANGQTIWNFSLIRNYALAERLKAQFRAEVYNAMNHPIFDAPNRTPTSSAFGTVTSSVSEPRAWQFALRLTF